ncbi:MAG: 3-methyl-2-oxobutanoate hydroxymethyltransferase [Verrucomicrobiota bacterium]|jgi:3-methyl-2-oxobutanoate hydroxymethyltransferase
MNSAGKAQQLRESKGLRRITALTAYDYPMARLLDEASIDLLLVGDSLGMVVLGFPDTTHVTLEHMIHHTAAVARAKPKALVLGDLPIHTYDEPTQALGSAQQLIAAGADAVKLEGGEEKAATVRTLRDAGIEVIGHIGMLPQHVLEEGGYRKKGKTPAAADQLLRDALALQDAGACALVLESIVPEVAAQITNDVAIPTIGIGCGENTCDGEVAVITDLLGSYPWFVPPFARPEADVASAIRHAALAFRKRVDGESSV